MPTKDHENVPKEWEVQGIAGGTGQDRVEEGVRVRS